ncbi:MAG: DUF924 domain-containing protein [Gammaproteobacteria bacterium]|nr:DUF924 domain-containing protein [Gammaproteobacteria bacterium]
MSKDANNDISRDPAEDHAAALAVVQFWLGPSVDGPEPAETRRAFWYHGGEAVDMAIRERFEHRLRQALAGELDHWAHSAQGALALVILLDQFTRNIYRSTPQAYAGDPRALGVAERSVQSGLHRQLPVTGRIFLYHPFHHAESLADQDRAVALVDAIRHDVDADWHDYLDRRVAGFARHRDIVARFGRFPHRNPILGRVSTPEEATYLAGDHESFGQGGRATQTG